jgi:drug/metabolite transporter (DMT)-like permease
MLFDLLMSIISSALLFVILKKFSSWGVVTVHGILFNYFTAAGLSLLLSDLDWTIARNHILIAWPYTIGIGLLFILVFVLTGITAQKNGMATASIASKMSMVIPISIGIVFYKDSMDIQKGIGLAMALPAVLLTVDQSGSKTQGRFDLRFWLLPILLFLGAGLVDSAIKFAQHILMGDGNDYLIIAMIFASAGCFGLIKLTYDSFAGKEPLKWVSFLGGLLLGSVNFCSLYFLVRCLDSPGAESSFVFAIVNVGVVLLSFFIGWMVFNEKPNARKIIGLVLALISIVVLAV